MQRKHKMGMSFLFSCGKFTSRNIRLLKQSCSSQEKKWQKFLKLNKAFLKAQSTIRKLGAYKKSDRGYNYFMDIFHTD